MKHAVEGLDRINKLFDKYERSTYLKCPISNIRAILSAAGRDYTGLETLRGDLFLKPLKGFYCELYSTDPDEDDVQSSAEVIIGAYSQDSLTTAIER